MRLADEGLFLDDLPVLDPIVAHEQTDNGWRALTANGEVLTVNSGNGHMITVPEGDIVVMQQGRAVGRRSIRNEPGVDIDAYLDHFERASRLFRNNEIEAALIEADAAVAIVPTVRARFNRAFMLLSAGRWPEGLEDYEWCERGPPFQRPLSRQAQAAGIKPWRGENIKGKRLLLLHDHGYGDSIMCLRYVPQLQAMGAEVTMVLPPELRRLARQLEVPIVDAVQDADYFCPMLMLLYALRQTPENISSDPYLITDAALRQRWQARLQYSERKRIGIAWSVGVQYEDDYPRAIPLKLLDILLPQDVDLFSLQVQGGEEAQTRGVNVFPFEDFADCAAFMTQMDEIVTVDTAAVHLAGAIGHPRVSLLLSHWASWRWLADWYPNVTLCRQSGPDDWASALAQLP